jgi:hypothetical protein
MHSLVAALALSTQWPATAETYAFEPKPDDFRSTAFFDLRSLNEKQAGESGFVTVDEEGGFRLGNGKPVRFWAVNTGVGREKPWAARPRGRKTEPELARHARFLAKRGVNMVRYHGHINPPVEKRYTDVDEKEVDWAWRLVAEMKKEGIYTTLSPYWAVPMKFGKDWDVPGGADQSALGLLFFDPALQTAYKSWLRRLFATPNPHTGIPLAKDPALAIIQLQNEDSLLFWTVNNLKGAQRDNLGRKFADAMRKKYGTLPGAFQAWDGNRLPGDKPENGILDFHNIWEMTQARQGGMARRLGDQLEFWTRTMYDFNREMARFLRQELGCRQVINAGNWRTADTLRLNDAERWSYTANEVMAVNRYFGGIHKGPNEGWSIQNGDVFTSVSALKQPNEFPLNLKQVAGRPMLVTESAWVFPNGYAAEGPFLIATYQSLTGVDGYYWFATGDDEWTPPQSANGYNEGQQKWMFGDPDTLGTFPAAALMYRQSYLKQGAPVVQEVRSLPEIWERRTPIIAEESGFDPNRDTGDIAPRSSVKTAVDPFAFLVGPVTVKYDGDSATSRVTDLAPFIDRARGEIKANTGEVALNYRQGICTVNAPSAQGVTGFFSGSRRHALRNVTFTIDNPYGAFLAVSMDGLPLSTSKKILVQAGTQSRPTGWKERAQEITLDGGAKQPGYVIESFGGPPWRVVSPQVRVEVRNPQIRRAFALDSNGNELRAVPLETTGASKSFTFPKDAMYVGLRE